MILGRDEAHLSCSNKSFASSYLVVATSNTAKLADVSFYVSQQFATGTLCEMISEANDSHFFG